MTDRELLELAAKAAGIEIEEWQGNYPIVDGHNWHPLSDDGDALVLSVKLQIDLCINHASIEAVWYNEDLSETNEVVEYYNEPHERLDATRRAIVCAAAKMRKQASGKNPA